MVSWVKAVLWLDPCAYCGEPGGTVDHITAVNRGERAEPDNLTGACEACNGRKADLPLLEFLRGREPRRPAEAGRGLRPGSDPGPV